MIYLDHRFCSAQIFHDVCYNLHSCFPDVLIVFLEALSLPGWSLWLSFLTSENAGREILRNFFQSSKSALMMFGPKTSKTLYRWTAFGNLVCEDVTSYAWQSVDAYNLLHGWPTLMTSASANHKCTRPRGHTETLAYVKPESGRREI